MSINGTGNNTHGSKTLDQRELLQDFSDDELYDTTSSEGLRLEGKPKKLNNFLHTFNCVYDWVECSMDLPFGCCSSVSNWTNGLGTSTKAPPLVL